MKVLRMWFLNHIKPNCPKLKPKASHTKSPVSNQDHKSTTWTGLYAIININGINSNFLIETGANVTIILTKYCDRINQTNSADLQPCLQHLGLLSI